jgi:acyl dehydratase
MRRAPRGGSRMPEKRKAPEEMLEEEKKRIGRWSEEITYRYPVEYEPISRYCRMVDDDNPLFLDPEYGAKTKWKGVILPPFAAFGILMPGYAEIMMRRMPRTPGPFVINMSQEYEFFRPVLVGDRLSFISRVADIYSKPTRIDPKAWWIVLEFSYKDQAGQQVCLIRNLLISHRSPKQVAEEDQ